MKEKTVKDTAKQSQKFWTAFTRKELLSLPVRTWNSKSVYDSIIVIPSNKKHESGYALMAIVGVIKGTPKEIAALCDDLIMEPPVSCISCDMSFGHNILRFHSYLGKFLVGHSLSSTTVTVLKGGAE